MGEKSWTCATNSNHTFGRQEAEANSYFCPKCPFGEGILIETDAIDFEKPKHPSETKEGRKGREEVQPRTLKVHEDLGLAMILVDCSGSMKDPAFKNNPKSKKDLIANSVAAGIFSLAGNPLRKYAYVLIIGFDHEIDILLPYVSIEEIVEKYKNAPELEQMLKREMAKKDGATDINGVLKIAYNFTRQFINSEIEALGIYKPRIQTVLDDNLESRNVPNVRVLLFTDGEHYMGDDNKTLHPSPFKNLDYKGELFDPLMTAFYGSENENGGTQLRTLVSKCPRHPSQDQFFLFNHPSQVANLKGLFRMASGASGFCPSCLAEANMVIRDN
jgi:hypothetical protein